MLQLYKAIVKMLSSLHLKVCFYFFPSSITIGFLETNEAEVDFFVIEIVGGLKKEC